VTTGHVLCLNGNERVPVENIRVMLGICGSGVINFSRGFSAIKRIITRFCAANSTTDESPFILILRGPFAKFVDSPYYSELELCGGAATVSFSKCLPW
jgi:hypothetical protein